MDINEDPELSKGEKLSRFGCGALLGIFVGIYLVFQFALSSSGLSIVTILGAIFVCGILALKYGDEFWYSIFRR